MAMSAAGIRRWYLVHKWTSIVSTVFLLMFALTGLPLIFDEEIDHATRPAQAVSSSTAMVPLDTVIANALAGRPAGAKMLYLTPDHDKPVLYVTTAMRADAPDSAMTFEQFDSRTGTRIENAERDRGVMAFLLELHSSLLLGRGGELFLGGIGIVFFVSVVSGVVVYAPFMRRLAFGTVRKNRNARVKWLDTHNMVGIVTLGWVSVVALSGVILTFSAPITAIWQADELADMAAPYRGSPPPVRLSSLDRAIAAVKAEVPGAKVSFIAFPGTPYSTQHHYMIALKGDTPATERLIRPAMVDAATGRLTDLRDAPLYMKALFLSGPLHFGDYGGLPLKIIWALLDVALIVVLGTGLYLWLGRKGAPAERRLEALNRAHGLLEPAE
jgi:uncharacterized iron-regulated membrane protein